MNYSVRSIVLALLTIAFVGIDSGCGRGGNVKDRELPRRLRLMMNAERQLGQSRQALETARALVDQCPDSREADSARIELAELVAEASKEGARANARAPAATDRRTNSKWIYSSTEDAMTGRSILGARAVSENLVDLRPPYERPQRGTLVLRRHPRAGTDVLFMIERGQLLCEPYDQGQIVVRFDREPPKTWRVSESADHSSTVLFLGAPARFIRQLERSERLRLEVPIYENGQTVFEFDVAGLDQNKLAEGSGAGQGAE